MSKGNAGLLPRRHHMTQAEVIFYLKRQVLEDAQAHGWLRPSVRRMPNGSIYYPARDVERVSERIAQGEYPGQAVVMA